MCHGRGGTSTFLIGSGLLCLRCCFLSFFDFFFDFFLASRSSFLCFFFFFEDFSLESDSTESGTESGTGGERSAAAATRAGAMSTIDARGASGPAGTFARGEDLGVGPASSTFPFEVWTSFCRRC